MIDTINNDINNSNKIELLIWMNGKPKDYSFKYILENIPGTSFTVERLKYLLTKYIINSNKLLNLFNINNKNDSIQHLYTKNEVELEDFDIPHLKDNDIIFFAFELLATYKSSNNFYQYEFIRWIKSGGFGNIYLAKEVDSNKDFAVKEISVKNFSNENLYNISRESMILKEMSHINIIKFHRIFTYNQKFYIIMDFARGGELSSILSSNKPLKEEHAKNLFHQIYNAVCYIHSKNIIHRDLKPNNILFLDEEKTHIIIIDFGISGSSNGNQKELVKAGTQLYLPPEVLTGVEFSSSTKLDIWALGIILYQMVEGCHPFENKNKKGSVINNILKNKLEFNKKIQISESLKKLLQGLLEKNYRFRIDTGDPLFEKWFEDNSKEKTKVIKKVKKNKSVEEDMYSLDYLNKYYGSDRYSKYYEDENERKIIQSSSTKIVNNYLSQTKSTSSKIKPKKIYVKNNYIEFMKKNSFKILVRKKKIKELMSTEKDDDNIYELDKFRSSTRHNQLILPPINLKSRNIFQVSNLKLNEAKSIKEVNKIIFPKSFK
jgi:serine/threonine protein kinase